MAKRKKNPAQAKAAKQKKIAIGGGVLLVVVMAIQLPTLMKKMSGNGGQATPAWLVASRAQGGGATPVPGVPASLAAPTLAGGVPTPTAAAGAGGSGLTAELAPTASVGQLSSFGRFASKDPFASQAPTPTPTAASSGAGGSRKPPPTVPKPPTPVAGSSGTGTGVTSTGGTSTVGTSTPPAPPIPAPTSAIISVNGIQTMVAVGTDFPAAGPLFHLVSLTQHSAKIAIAGGSYANGAPAIVLNEGKPLTLQNTADGTRYTIELFKQGTLAPAAPAAPAAPVVPAGTTTTSGTTTSGG